jgi:glucose/arabinose dehydrogenase
VAAVAVVGNVVQHDVVGAQTPPEPSVVDTNLRVRTAAAEFEQPIGMAFLGEDDYFVLEKASGRVWRVEQGARTVVLDLPVNSASERGLLSIALHPRFSRNPGVYLYWTESSTGQDSVLTLDVPRLGNRVDRYAWNGTMLTHDADIVRLRARQADAGQPERGNHDGGVIRFGPDGKLYVFVGDLGRRGWLQNLFCGPTATCPGQAVPDDQFGGPRPDNAHVSGSILRLNDDGTTPSNNPFVATGEAIGGEVGTNIKKVFAYGFRNPFGMAFDPVSDRLWPQENGDDSFSELNLVQAGLNGGWIQVMGRSTASPSSRRLRRASGSSACGRFAGRRH